MCSVKPRIITTFDLFVVVVILGYLLVVVQSAMRGDGPRLRSAPSSQLHREAMPAEWPTGAALTCVPVEPDDSTY
jgi:hypothetical protein